VLLGSNHDEASAFSPTWQISTTQAYQALLDQRLALHSARRGHNLARISSLVRRAKDVFRDAE
jgi:hypothetical protein